MRQNTEAIANSKLDIEYYGADFPVDVLVKRIEAEDFIIPGFQREYVWKQNQASQFIESLVIGFPTPSLFLAKDKFSNKYLVIDGQQRLKALQSFYKEYFPDGKKFKLTEVIESINGKTYSSLSPSDRRSLDNAIIHCTIISENYDSIGIFHVFERLNTKGTPLTDQEIRNAIYHGSFSDLIRDLSEKETWQNLYGKTDNRAIKQGLILRFLALYFDLDNYRGRVADFLNYFMFKNKNLDIIPANEIQKVFLNTIEFINSCLGSKAFYRGNSFNQALYESLMMLTAKELKKNSLSCQKFKKFYDLLINDDHFWTMVKQRFASSKKLRAILQYVEDLYRNM